MPDGMVTTVQDRITVLVVNILAEHKIVREVAPNALLADVGITSVEMVNLMLAVEAEFDLMIPSGEITPENFRSVSAIAALVARL